MKHINAESILNEMTRQDIFTKETYTYNEYCENLIKIQNFVSKIIFGKNANPDTRMSEALAQFDSKVREDSLQNNQVISKAHNAFKLINKELCVSLAGRNGEERVQKEIMKSNRNDIKVFKNVYVSDEYDQTELDDVILTKNGIIILEVKNTKSDVTINPQGRIAYEGKSVYHDFSIGDKMTTKRNLLEWKLEKMMEEQHIYVPLYIDSLVVFSTGKRIHVSDKYKKEDYCLSNNLPEIINNYSNDITYMDREYNALASILGSIETNQKGFAPTFNVNELKENIANGLEILLEAERFTPANLFRKLAHHNVSFITPSLS